MGRYLKKVQFHYIKSPNHVEIKVDGAFGGVGPTGDTIAVSVYTERNPIPTLVVYEMEDIGDGRSKLGSEVSNLREGRKGVVRIVQATLHMSLDQANSLHDWLGTHIKTLEKAEESHDNH